MVKQNGRTEGKMQEIQKLLKMLVVITMSRDFLDENSLILYYRDQRV